MSNSSGVDLIKFELIVFFLTVPFDFAGIVRSSLFTGLILSNFALSEIAFEIFTLVSFKPILNLITFRACSEWKDSVI